ncbi:MAG: type transport system ATP-binding protein, partial [Gaiellales bacterium]|nr:type transport system ATP-binding protein [Gaiellales bacterium]
MLSIEVSHVHKTFQIPGARPDTFKERAMHPLRRTDFQELKVLDDVSFEIRRGEFFGVTGRNGSGKSTLLKLMASVYRIDSGRIRVAGLLAPIIELGVGFEDEFSAKENVILNGLMMGLTAKEASRRFDKVIDFAELGEFVDLKLKNYSSGMRVRLAFATMIQSEPDVMLLDEVLAVGDRSFQEKCDGVFEDYRRHRGKTIVLVTHAMSRIEEYCDRAILLERGKVETIGDPRTVAKSYGELPARSEMDASRVERAPVEVVELTLSNGDGRSARMLGPGGELCVAAGVEASAMLDKPKLWIDIRDETGVRLFVSPGIDLKPWSGDLAASKRVTVRTRIENRLRPGRFVIGSVVTTGDKVKPGIS